MYWNQLPLEVQSSIYDAVPASSATHPLARCAAVCKRWQGVFERKAFQRLTLRTSCLADFERILASVPERRAYIQHIHLRVELQEYTCDDCAPSSRRFSAQLGRMSLDDVLSRRRLERRAIADRNNRLFREAMIRLFDILHTWQASCCPAGIVLEISAVSPSDRDHFFQADVYLNADGSSMDTASTRKPDLPYQSLPAEPHDPRHGWVRGRRVQTPNFTCIDRVFGPLTRVFPDFLPQELPSVSFIRTLLLRRQTRRWVDMESLRAILLSLPGLEMFMYEPWRPLGDNYDSGYLLDREYFRVFSSGFPPNLKHLIVFEDFNEDLNRASRGHSTIHDSRQRPEIVRTPSPSVGRALAVASRTLTNLSISYLVEARAFFLPTACGTTTGTWDRLESLVLTSLALRGESPHQEVASLLSLAGRTAIFMPKLHTMELWYGARQIASVFRYRVEEGKATIAWLSTRRFDIQSWPEIEEAWQQVSFLHTTRPLVAISHEMLDAEPITSQAEAVARLRIHCTVAHPASLEEIQREAGRYWSFQIDQYIGELPFLAQLQCLLRLYTNVGDRQAAALP